MRILGLSGGSTKGIGMLGICQELHKKGIGWDVIVGTSVGAILSVPIAMAKYDESVAVFKAITVESIFKVPPINKKGKIGLKALKFLLRNKLAIGDMSNVRSLISSIITPDVFEEYRNGDYAVCYAVSVDMITGKRVMRNLKDSSYGLFLDYVLASSSIPVFTMPVFISDLMLYDGGIRDHVSNHAFINQQATECYTVFSREKEPRLRDWYAKDVLDVLERTIDIMNLEVSKDDERLIDEKCGEYNVMNYKFYLPAILESLYDTDPRRLEELYNAGVRIGKSFDKTKDFFVKT